jgi:hypothetical protein
MPAAAALTCGGNGLGGHRAAVFPCGHAFRLRCLHATRPAAERERLRKDKSAGAEAALVAECPLCGWAMLESVTQPIVDSREDALLLQSWAI